MVLREDFDKMAIREIVSYDPNDWEGIKVPNFRDADRAWKFLKKHGFRRLPSKSERVFLKNTEICVSYARRVGSRLPVEFENEIKKNINHTFEYILHVLGGPCEDFEEVLSSRPMYLVRYAKEVVKGRLSSSLEEKLIGDPYACFEYSYQILNGRLPENLHNYMFAAVMDSSFTKRYRGYASKLVEEEEYSPDYISPSEYFEFIKYQRKSLHKLITHYGDMYGMNSNSTLGEFLYELEHGR